MTVEPMGQRGRRFEYLDLLRLVCASAVVLLHYGVMAPYTGVLPARYYFAPNVLVYGQFGVHIFFIISGFVITLSARGRTAGAFLWARFLRLYPAYWLCCTITVLTLLCISTHHATLWTPNLKGFFVNLTMAQSYLGVPNVDEVYWSLAVELRFYLMVACVMLVGIKMDSIWVVCIWLVACSVAPWAPIIGKLAMATTAPYFITGILIQFLATRGFKWSAVSLLPVALILAAHSIIDQHHIHMAMKYYPYNPLIAIALVIAGAGLVLACAFAPSPHRYAKTLMTIGAVTYPLYLLHGEVGMMLITRLDKYAPPAMTEVLVIALVVAFVTLIAVIIEPRLRIALKAAGQRLWMLLRLRLGNSLQVARQAD